MSSLTRSPLSFLSRIQSTLTTLQARWSYPRNHFYLCLLGARSFAMPMLWCLPLAFKPPKLPCQTSNPPYPSKPLIVYVTALLSPSYSVASCRWRLEAVPCWNIFYFTCLDIIILLCYLNASIYLVKGGTLGLSPSVLFHSCRPSFRHIGVMFRNFAFLTRLGYNGNPLTVRLE